METAFLCRALQETRPWIEQFRKKTYEEAFKAYTERYGPGYLEAVRETGEAGLPHLAEEILDGIEAGWRRQRAWNRGVARAVEKQMAVCYLSPMLLELPEPLCRTLCELLRESWAARWPGNAYGTAAYQELMRGFRNTVMGFEIGKRDRDGE